MSDQNGTTTSHDEDVNPTGEVPSLKGKGKAVDHAPELMDEDEDTSDEETGAEEDAPEEEAEDSEDELNEIDMDNIVEGGRRTRGKTIDFAKAAEEAGDDLEDDEDDDDDFEEAEEDEDAMHE